MHDFRMKNDRLFCEQVAMSRIAREVGTPVFVYSRKTLLDHLRKLQTAFAERRPLICYSMKANSSLSLCRLLVKAGAGLDIVSGGELFRALKVGAAAKRIVYASVGKTVPEIEAAIRAGILFFNVESVPELELINTIAGRLGVRQRVALRLNPDVNARTHAYISTARKQSKFGIDRDTVREIVLKRAPQMRHVEVACLHTHIGSQIIHAGPLIRAVKKSLALREELNRRGARITHLNIGGGLGIIYRNEKPQTAQEYAAAILPLLRKSDVQLILEPGRFIVGNAGILLTSVLYMKQIPGKRFVIVDAAMNDLVRPALYDAYHEVVVVNRTPGAKLQRADVVGPVCESGDFLAKDRPLPVSLRSGDALAVMGAGAYGFSMSSNYNSRCRSAEVLVAGKRYFVIRERERYHDLTRQEKIVNA